MTAKPDWRQDIDDAYKKMELAETYADDGAYLTAADRLEDAVRLFRKGAEERNRAMGL